MGGQAGAGHNGLKELLDVDLLGDQGHQEHAHGAHGAGLGGGEHAGHHAAHGDEEHNDDLDDAALPDRYPALLGGVLLTGGAPVGVAPAGPGDGQDEQDQQHQARNDTGHKQAADGGIGGGA